MTTKVIIYGVGQMNMLATRLLKDRGIEIAGAINRPGPKIGKDLGLLAGIGYLNVPISDDPEKVLSKTADIVIVAVASELPTMFPIYKQCLEAKKNVATIGESSSFSWRLYPELTIELDNIAKKNGVTITGTGAQDFGIVHLGILMSGACHTIDKIIYRCYFDPTNFGEETRATLSKSPSMYTTFWDNVASALDLTIIDVKENIDDSGTQLSITTEEGIKMIGEYKFTTEKEFKEWEIQGEPNLKVKVNGLGSPVVTSVQTVNRIPHILQAPPGYVTIEKLPILKYQSFWSKQPTE
jgi:4-hydroxy-tetrahydrodipicolinate reductase